MNTQHDNSNQAGHTKAGRRGKLWAVVGAGAIIIGALSLAGTSFARDGMGFGMHHGGMHAMDPAAMDAHIDQMAKRVLPDGTPEQQAKVASIAKAALADLKPMHTQLDAAHKQFVTLLSAPTIDRAALEQLRSEQIHQADLASQRILQAVEDAAEVLTPAQRAKLAEHLASHHGHH